MTTLERAKEEVITQSPTEALQNQVIGHTIAVPTFPTNALPGNCNKSPGPRWAPDPGPTCCSSLLLWIMKAVAYVRVAATPLLQSQNGSCFLRFEEGQRRSRKQILAKATSDYPIATAEQEWRTCPSMAWAQAVALLLSFWVTARQGLTLLPLRTYPIHPSLHGHLPVFWEKWMDPTQCLLYPFCIPLPNI